jgi:uncharacterized membrane protein YeiH
MMEVTPFQFPYVLEVLATIAWAVSGAIVARHRGLDFMGVFVISTIASTGGGLLRDGIFLQRTPVVVTNPLYLIVPFSAMIVISLFGGVWEKLPLWDKLASSIDAIGTPAFTLLGFQLSFLAGVPFTGSLFIGLLNGVSGGILRDVLVGDVPRFFRPGQLSGSIAIASVFLYAGLLGHSDMHSDIAAWIAIITAAIARWLVIRFNWQTQPVNQWHLERELARMPKKVSKRYRDATANRGSQYDMD